LHEIVLFYLFFNPVSICGAWMAQFFEEQQWMRLYFICMFCFPISPEARRGLFMFNPFRIFFFYVFYVPVNATNFAA